MPIESSSSGHFPKLHMSVVIVNSIRIIERIYDLLVNAIIEKYRQQRPLPQTFGKYGVKFESQQSYMEFSRLLILEYRRSHIRYGD